MNSPPIWGIYKGVCPLVRHPAQDRILELKEQIALRVDKEVLECYRSLGVGWQTRMNAVLKAYRDASV